MRGNVAIQAVCGGAFAGTDASVYVKYAVSFTLDQRGGEGAFREVSERIVVASGREGEFSSHSGFVVGMYRARSYSS